MAFYDTCRAISRPAAIDLSAFQYQFCILDSSGAVESGTTTLTAQGAVTGIVGEAVTAGVAVPVVVPDGGIAKIKLGATLAAGALIATAADGRAIAHGATAGDICWGTLIEGGDADEIVPFQFMLTTQVA